MGLIGQYPAGLFLREGEPWHSGRVPTDDFRVLMELQRRRACAPITRHQTESCTQTECAPLVPFGSVAEQGNKMQIGKELQGLSSQADDP